MITNVTEFFCAQPADVQYFVGGTVEASRCGGGVDVHAEIKRVYGDTYSDEEIEALIYGAGISNR